MTAKALTPAQRGALEWLASDPTRAMYAYARTYALITNYRNLGKRVPIRIHAALLARGYITLDVEGGVTASRYLITDAGRAALAEATPPQSEPQQAR